MRKRNRTQIRRTADNASRFVVALGLLCLFACARAYGDVGVVLNESLDTSVAWVTGSGHTAVYISRACPETPVKLRLCRPGEAGSVISNYTTLGEDQPYQWNAVPLSIYLYGVEDPRNRPLFGSPRVKRALEERYREKYLSAYCTTKTCLTSGKAEWREMVGATISRSVYIFVVKTTADQDKELIAELNAEPNQNHFNGITRNCATFARRIIDTYFPGSAKPDYINDFGMTSPKAIARSFSHYAARHPDLEFRVLHFAQVPGTYRRSTECRDGTEQLYHSKKLLIPMALFADHELPIVFASYVLTGRFNPEHEWEKFPIVRTGQLADQAKAAKKAGDNALRNELIAQEKQDRAAVVGTPSEWKDYRREFDDTLDDAVSHEAIPDRDYVKRFFKYIDEKGTPVLDCDGSLWIRLPDAGVGSRIGLSASNLLSQSSGAPLANQFMLARVYSVLRSPKHSRESMQQLKADWELLEQTQSERVAWATRAAGADKRDPSSAEANDALDHAPENN
jgi:hypothetical protein